MWWHVRGLRTFPQREAALVSNPHLRLLILPSPSLISRPSHPQQQHIRVEHTFFLKCHTPLVNKKDIFCKRFSYMNCNFHHNPLLNCLLAIPKCILSFIFKRIVTWRAGCLSFLLGDFNPLTCCCCCCWRRSCLATWRACKEKWKKNVSVTAQDQSRFHSRTPGSALKNRILASPFPSKWNSNQNFLPV